jgi:hypothetical protein
MTDEAAELIRQAIGGDRDAIAWVGAQVDMTEDPMLLVMAGLLSSPACSPEARTLLDRAAAVASRREDRQLVAIAQAHVAGDLELVDALARDHLVDFPGSYVVAWVASGAQGLAFKSKAPRRG